MWAEAHAFPQTTASKSSQVGPVPLCSGDGPWFCHPLSFAVTKSDLRSNWKKTELVSQLPLPEDYDQKWIWFITVTWLINKKSWVEWKPQKGWCFTEEGLGKPISWNLLGVQIRPVASGVPTFSASPLPSTLVRTQLNSTRDPREGSQRWHFIGKAGVECPLHPALPVFGFFFLLLFKFN